MAETPKISKSIGSTRSGAKTIMHFFKSSVAVATPTTVDTFTQNCEAPVSNIGDLKSVHDMGSFDTCTDESFLKKSKVEIEIVCESPSTPCAYNYSQVGEGSPICEELKPSCALPVIDNAMMVEIQPVEPMEEEGKSEDVQILESVDLCEPSDKGKKARPKRARKPVLKPEAATAELVSAVCEDTAIPAPVKDEKNSVVWLEDSESFQRMKHCCQRIKNFANEFILCEKNQTADEDLDIALLTSNVLSLFNNCANCSTEAVPTEAVPETETAIDSVVESSSTLLEVPTATVMPIPAGENPIKNTLRALIGGLAQGKSCSVDKIIDLVQSKFAEIKESLTGAVIADNLNYEFMCLLGTNRGILKDEINTILKRESYGYTFASHCNETDELMVGNEMHNVGLFRWEILHLSHFCSASQAVVNNMRSVRMKYSRVLKAIGKVIDYLVRENTKVAKKAAVTSEASVDNTNSALSQLEDKVNKAIVDLEKYKEKVRELEKKKADEIIEQQKKEQLKEQKRREKEEVQQKKQQEVLSKQVEKEKERQMIADKEAKEQRLKDRQRSMLMSFVVAKPEPAQLVTLEKEKTACVSNTVVCKNPFWGPLILTDKDDSVSEVECLGSTYAANTAVHSRLMCGPLPIRKFDIKRFEEEMRSGVSSGFQFSTKIRKSKSLRPKRKMKKITTAVTSMDVENPFSNGFSEVKDVYVENYYRVLQFGEDVRPPYCGTFSKKSKLLNGRRPFVKDTELFNYEYDSEADWDEEDMQEGEDIELSDGEDDEEDEDEGVDPNNLMYDDFCRHDSDMGSDVDEESGEKIVRKKSSTNKVKLESLGPLFISTSSSTDSVFVASLNREIELKPNWTDCTKVLKGSDTEAPLISSDIRVEEIKKLMMYTSVCYDHTKHLFPKLGHSIVRASSTTEDAPSSSQKPPAKAAVAKEAAAKKAKDQSDAIQAAIPEVLKLVHGSKAGLDRLVLSFFEGKKTKSVSSGSEDLSMDESQPNVVADCSCDAESPSELSPAVDGNEEVLEGGISKACVRRIILEHAVKSRGKLDGQGSEESKFTYGTARWVVRSESWEKYCCGQVNEIIFTPPKLVKSTKSVLSSDPTARQLSVRRKLDTLYESAPEKQEQKENVVIPTDYANLPEKSSADVVVVKEKKRIAPTLVSKDNLIGSPVLTTAGVDALKVFLDVKPFIASPGEPTAESSPVVTVQDADLGLPVKKKRITPILIGKIGNE